LVIRRIAAMTGRKPVIGVLLAIVMAYGVYPYVALYRLGHALRSGDAATLGTMVDWTAVREGIKEDICDQVIDQPQEAQSGGQLPPFGSGFVRGIATNVVDRRVTPEALVAATQLLDTTPAVADGAMRVRWAFFVSPGAFVVDLAAPGQADPIRLQMDLRDGHWQVTRVWLPPDLLGQANART
jgi:hypothetical protein